MPTSLAASRTPLPLIAGFALFLVVIAYALTASFVRPSVITYEPTPLGGSATNGEVVADDPASGDSAAREPATDTITIDATNDRGWSYLDLDRGTGMVSPDSVGWDLGFRRHTFVAAAGVRDLGALPWDSVTQAPAADYPVTLPTTDAANPVLRRWYHYRMLTHVLEPKTNVYVIRTAEGRYAKLQILSYYCPGPRAGCPTVRYSLIPGPG